MKLLTFIISILLLSYIITGECDSKTSAKKVSECKDLSVDTANNYKYCCYAKYDYKDPDGSKKTYEGCYELKQADYDKIKDFIKEWEKDPEFEVKVKKLDCHSVYLTGSILSLLLLLL